MRIGLGVCVCLCRSLSVCLSLCMSLSVCYVFVHFLLCFCCYCCFSRCWLCENQNLKIEHIHTRIYINIWIWNRINRRFGVYIKRVCARVRTIKIHIFICTNSTGSGEIYVCWRQNEDNLMTNRTVKQNRFNIFKENFSSQSWMPSQVPTLLLFFFVVCLAPLHGHIHEKYTKLFKLDCYYFDFFLLFLFCCANSINFFRYFALSLSPSCAFKYRSLCMYVFIYLYCFIYLTNYYFFACIFFFLFLSLFCCFYFQVYIIISLET